LNPQKTDLEKSGATVHPVSSPVSTSTKTTLQTEIPKQEPIADPQVIAKKNVYKIRLAKEPDNVVLWGEYGDFLARTGAYDDALIQYFSILEMQPEDTTTYRKIVALYKQINNIPKAIEQLLQILHIRPDDIEAQEELARLNPPIPGDKLPSSSSSQQEQIPGPEQVQEPVKPQENKKDPRLLIVSGIAVAAVIALAVVFLQKPSTLPPPPPSSSSEKASKNKKDTGNLLLSKYCGTWEYGDKYSGDQKTYIKISKHKPGIYKFERGYIYQGKIIWYEPMVEKNGVLVNAGSIYLNPLNGKLKSKFVSNNFYATHGAPFTYELTLDIKSDNKLLYSVYSSIRGETDKYEVTKVSD
jgi:tetratricopeptide (TPR) repeat protein